MSESNTVTYAVWGEFINGELVEVYHEDPNGIFPEGKFMPGTATFTKPPSTPEEIALDAASRAYRYDPTTFPAAGAEAVVKALREAGWLKDE